MKKRVVIDTDPGVDDALALLLALRSPELRVEAITTVNGNVDVEQATKNAALILDLLDPNSPPILARGAAKPIKNELITAKPIHGSDGLGQLNRFKNLKG
ncbi:MAG: nucleoside hydrolase, partial [Desulfatiglandales bacterium]